MTPKGQSSLHVNVLDHGFFNASSNWRFEAPGTYEIMVEVYAAKQAYPTNTKVHFSALTDAQNSVEFFWDFGDFTSARNMLKTITKQYNEPGSLGEFPVEVTVFNLVSRASLRRPIFVVDTHCQPPPVKNMGPHTIQVPRHEGIRLGVTYESEFDCDTVASGGVQYTWTLFDSLGEAFPLSRVETHRQSLVTVVGSAVYSNYRVKLQVVETPPVAIVQGGTNVFINNRNSTVIVLDGTQSYDPDYPHSTARKVSVEIQNPQVNWDQPLSVRAFCDECTLPSLDLIHYTWSLFLVNASSRPVNDVKEEEEGMSLWPDPQFDAGDEGSDLVDLRPAAAVLQQTLLDLPRDTVPRQIFETYTHTVTISIEIRSSIHGGTTRPCPVTVTVQPHFVRNTSCSDPGLKLSQAVLRSLSSGFVNGVVSLNYIGIVADIVNRLSLEPALNTQPLGFLPGGVGHVALLNADFESAYRWRKTKAGYSLRVKSSRCVSWEPLTGTWSHYCKTISARTSSSVNCSVSYNWTVLCVLLLGVAFYVGALVWSLKSGVGSGQRRVHFLSDNLPHEMYHYAVTLHTGLCSAAQLSAKLLRLKVCDYMADFHPWISLYSCSKLHQRLSLCVLLWLGYACAGTVTISQLLKARQRQRYLRLVRPPSLTELRKSRYNIKRERLICETVWEWFVFASLLSLMLCVANGSFSSDYHNLNSAVKKHFIRAMAGFKLKQLESKQWLGRRTVVLKVHFTLYSPAPNLFTSVTLTVKQSVLGVLLPSAQTQSVPVVATLCYWYYVVLACKLLFLILLLLRLCHHILSLGEKGMLRYSKIPGNWLEVGVFVVAVLFYVYGLYRTALVSEVAEKLRRQNSETHIDLSELATTDQVRITGILLHTSC
uniref:PKD/Chitinase domain-containing protein n=1 Tax=Knipowitschia caucasica TaxID=637954 RepID=A0AAV2LBV9_KNICA